MSATAYWTSISPKKGVDREHLISGCGRKCFLMPEQRKFPICRRCGPDRCYCKPDCSGLRAAINRSGQWGYPAVNKRARALFEQQGCEWRPGSRASMVRKAIGAPSLAPIKISRVGGSSKSKYGKRVAKHKRGTKKTIRSKKYGCMCSAL